MKQVMVKDLDNDEIHSGILLDTGDCICGECGSFLPVDERQGNCAEEEASWKIIKKYDTWINLDEEILGDDAESLRYNNREE